jgi:hypothetical protein
MSHESFEYEGKDYDVRLEFQPAEPEIGTMKAYTNVTLVREMGTAEWFQPDEISVDFQNAVEEHFEDHHLPHDPY